MLNHLEIKSEKPTEMNGKWTFYPVQICLDGMPISATKAEIVFEVGMLPTLKLEIPFLSCDISTDVKVSFEDSDGEKES